MIRWHSQNRFYHPRHFTPHFGIHRRVSCFQPQWEKDPVLPPFKCLAPCKTANEIILYCLWYDTVTGDWTPGYQISTCVKRWTVQYYIMVRFGLPFNDASSPVRVLTTYRNKSYKIHVHAFKDLNTLASISFACTEISSRRLVYLIFAK